MIEYKEFVSMLFELVLIPLLGILVKFAIQWINIKSEELKSQTNNELYYKYISMLEDIIVSCVLKTQQTYVESLKKAGKFDLEAQQKALVDTYQAVINQLSQEAFIFLEANMGDLKNYIITAIEKEVYQNKTR